MAPRPVQPQSADFAALDADFAKWMAEAHVPGLVWGIVKDGETGSCEGDGCAGPG
jgi:hypothetical protein